MPEQRRVELGTVSKISGIADIVDDLESRCCGMSDAHRNEKAKSQLLEEAEILRGVSVRLRTIMSKDEARTQWLLKTNPRSKP